MSFLAGLLAPKKPEKRAYPPSWLPGALAALLGGGKSSSGITVTESKALTYTAFYAAVDFVSRGVAQLPLFVYKRLADEGREKQFGDPRYTLLHTRPNPEQTAFGFFQSMQGHTLTWGNAYAEIERQANGLAKALWPLPPNRISVKRNKAKALVYEQKDERGQVVATIPAENMLHVHTLGDGLVGWSPVRQFREAIGLGLAEEQYGGTFFGNDARPGGVLEHPAQLGDKAAEHLLSSWRDEHGGSGNAHNPAILEEGMKWHTTGLPNDDAQFLESRTFQIREIAMIFHIPPHKLGELTRATFSNITHSAIEYVQDCLDPWLVNWEQELSWKLFRTAEHARLYAEFNVDGLLRGDFLTRSAGYATAIQNGWMTRNEVRAKENLNAIEGGDVPLVPKNLGPADKLGEEPEPAPAPPPPKDGESGKHGEAGKDGADGKDGRDGRDGKDGKAGEPGQRGLPGQGGRDGQPGKPGPRSEPGPEGAQGLQGPRGATVRVHDGDEATGVDLYTIEETHRALLLDICARIIRREVSALRKASQKMETFAASVDSFYADHAQYVAQLLRPTVLAYAISTGAPPTIASYIDVFAQTHAQRAHGSMRSSPEKLIESTLDQWEAQRPAWMADKILGDIRNAATEAQS